MATASTCDCVILFTKNNNQWAGKPITPDEAAKFKAAHAAAKLQHPLSHNSYLINLAAPDETLWEKSITAMIEELRRRGHSGHSVRCRASRRVTSSSEAAGLRRIIAGFDRISCRDPRRPSGDAA